MMADTVRPDFEQIAEYVRVCRELYETIGVDGPRLTRLSAAELRVAWENGEFDRSVPSALPDIDLDLADEDKPVAWRRAQQLLEDMPFLLRDQPAAAVHRYGR